MTEHGDLPEYENVTLVWERDAADAAAPKTEPNTEQMYARPEECRQQKEEKVYAVQPPKDGDTAPAQVQIDRIDDDAVVDGDKQVVESVSETPR